MQILLASCLAIAILVMAEAIASDYRCPIGNNFKKHATIYNFLSYKDGPRRSS